MKAVLRRADRSEEPADVLEVGELVIDGSRREVAFEGRDVELTRTEFDVLATMAAHPGRVYSRLQLLEAVMGFDYRGMERTIDAHV